MSSPQESSEYQIDFDNQADVDAAELQRQIELLEAEDLELSNLNGSAGVTDHESAPLPPSSSTNTTPYDQQAQAEADSRSIYVGNVDYAVTEADLRGLFEQCGEVTRITIPSDRDGRPKGYAYIEFKEAEGAGAAMLMTDRPLKGRQIQVAIKRTNTAGVSRGRGGPRGGARGGSRAGYNAAPHGYMPPPYGYPPPIYGGMPPPQYGYPPIYGHGMPQQFGNFRGGRGGARGGRGGRGGARQ